MSLCWTCLDKANMALVPMLPDLEVFLELTLIQAAATCLTGVARRLSFVIKDPYQSSLDAI